MRLFGMAEDGMATLFLLLDGVNPVVPPGKASHPFESMLTVV